MKSFMPALKSPFTIVANAILSFFFFVVIFPQQNKMDFGGSFFLKLPSHLDPCCFLFFYTVYENA